MEYMLFIFFFSSRRRHTRYWRDWSSDVCSSDLDRHPVLTEPEEVHPLLPEPLDRVVRDAVGLGVHDRQPVPVEVLAGDRSGERRGGEESRSRGSPYHLKKKTT